MKILETGMRMAMVMAYIGSAVGRMHALASAFLQVAISSLKTPVRVFGLPRSLLTRIRFLQKSLTDSSTPRPRYRLAITLHSLINPISTLCSHPPSVSSLLSSAIREQSSTETSSFHDLIRCTLLLPLLGIKGFRNYTGSVPRSRQCDNVCGR